MNIGTHQDIIGIQVVPSDKLSYDELKRILESDELQIVLEQNDFKTIISGRDYSIDALSLSAEVCDFSHTAMKFGDLTVIFRRLPLIEDQESELMTPRDIADKFVLAVEAYKKERDKVKEKEKVSV